MTRKIIIAVLLFSFVLSACGSNVETIPTSTPIPTLPATSTFTREPTATNTPIPTATSVPYTSCAQLALIDDIKSKFENDLNISISSFLENLINAGKYDVRFGYSKDNGVSTTDAVYIGYARISLGGLTGFKPSDQALCAYFATHGDLDVLSPIVLRYTRSDEFFWATALYDAREGFNEQAIYISGMSFQEVENWLSSGEGPVVGDVFSIRFQTFAGYDSIDLVESMDSSSQLFYKDQLIHLLRALGNSYFERLSKTDGTLSSSSSLLDSSKGDIGLFANMLQWYVIDI